MATKAPIVSAADVTFIGDLFQIVPLLTEKIRDYKEKNGLAFKRR
jgi:electron transfer flavoprotein alpha subunit